MNVAAIIPARSGSKGLPGKNLLDFNGKPLIAWTIRSAIEAGIKEVLVTTDSSSIAEVATDHGAFVVQRPAGLAADDTPMRSVVEHAIPYVAAKSVILLQPTSPLRAASDIVAALRLHFTTGQSVISVTAAKPWLFSLGQDGALAPLIELISRRQDAHVVAPNGAIYIFELKEFLGGRSWWDAALGYPMPPERSADIDTRLDFELAALIAKHGWD